MKVRLPVLAAVAALCAGCGSSSHAATAASSPSLSPYDGAEVRTLLGAAELQQADVTAAGLSGRLLTTVQDGPEGNKDELCGTVPSGSDERTATATTRFFGTDRENSFVATVTLWPSAGAATASVHELEATARGCTGGGTFAGLGSGQSYREQTSDVAVGVGGLAPTSLVLSSARTDVTPAGPTSHDRQSFQAAGRFVVRLDYGREQALTAADLAAADSLTRALARRVQAAAAG